MSLDTLIPNIPVFFPFKNHGNGKFSFEVEYDCGDNGLRLNCRVNLTDSDSTTYIGPFPKGEFGPVPDISGFGVLVGIFIPCAIVLLLAIGRLFYQIFSVQCFHTRLSYSTDDNRKSRLRAFAPVFFLGVSDYTLTLGLAYMLSFLLSSKCSLSVYHYYVLLDTTLLCLSTGLMAAQLGHKHYWPSRYFAAPFRIALMVVLFILLGTLLLFQAGMPYFPEWLPDASRNDSAILLPASCFLDPDLSRRDNPFSRGSGALKDAAQLARLGPTWKPIEIPEFSLFCILLLCALWTHVEILYRTRRAAKRRAVSKTNRRGKSFVLVWFITRTVCIAISITCTYHIWYLRTWVHRSGWMQTKPFNPEDNIWELGQLLPLLGLAVIVLQLLEACSSGGKKGNKVKGGYNRV